MVISSQHSSFAAINQDIQVFITYENELDAAWTIIVLIATYRPSKTPPIIVASLKFTMAPQGIAAHTSMEKNAP
jgi:hypothetical protein